VVILRKIFQLLILSPLCKYQESDTAEAKVSGRATVKVSERATAAAARIGFLPHGIVEHYSDMELKPLWFTNSVQSQVS
jgi:hypothetical protein